MRRRRDLSGSSTTRAPYSSHSCLVVRRDGQLTIDDLRFDFGADRVHRAGDGADVSETIEWATFGQRVLREGRVMGIDALAGQFYDVRHLLAFDNRHDAGTGVRQQIYEGYPEAFEANVRRAWKESGVPRARYVHNAVGLSADALFVIQREGTIEEIGAALATAGAEDGVILDNGGSVVCWVWWANLYAGGIISPTVDYRPPGTSAIAFVLKGPLNVELPAGACRTARTEDDGIRDQGSGSGGDGGDGEDSQTEERSQRRRNGEDSGTKANKRGARVPTAGRHRRRATRGASPPVFSVCPSLAPFLRL